MSQRKRTILPSPNDLLKEEFCRCGEPFSISDVRSRYGTTKKAVEEIINTLLEQGLIRRIEGLGKKRYSRGYADYFVVDTPIKRALRMTWR